jgi:nucleotide-binding universal stress UspA family protein
MSRTIGYRSILVPVANNVETDTALDVACRLATEHGASITALAVVEVPPVLPLGAHMLGEGADAKLLLRRAEAVGESYGIRVHGCVVRGRDAGSVIATEATSRDVELVVIGAARSRRGPFGGTVETVLKRSPCRVLVIAQPQSAAAVRTAA